MTDSFDSLQCASSIEMFSQNPREVISPNMEKWIELREGPMTMLEYPKQFPVSRLSLSFTSWITKQASGAPVLSVLEGLRQLSDWQNKSLVHISLQFSVGSVCNQTPQNTGSDVVDGIYILGYTLGQFSTTWKIFFFIPSNSVSGLDLFSTHIYFDWCFT